MSESEISQMRVESRFSFADQNANRRMRVSKVTPKRNHATLPVYFEKFSYVTIKESLVYVLNKSCFQPLLGAYRLNCASYGFKLNVSLFFSFQS
jgi:hypothetical protein